MSSSGRTPPLPWVQRGEGHTVVLLHGFGLVPTTYRRGIDRLAERCRVVAPLWLYVPGDWSDVTVWTSLDATLDAADVERATIVGHSLGGALALVYAARRPSRVRDLVLVDALGVTRRGAMARSALTGRSALRLASLVAARDFLATVASRPRDLARAGWWGFRRTFTDEMAMLAGSEVRTHVLWAEDDSLLDVEDGARLAHSLSATFTVVRPDRRPLDHDWPYRQPDRFVDCLASLGVLGEEPVTP